MKKLLVAALLLIGVGSAHAAGVRENVYLSTTGQQSCAGGPGCGINVASGTIADLKATNLEVTGTLSAGTIEAVISSTGPKLFVYYDGGGADLFQGVNQTGDNTSYTLRLSSEVVDNTNSFSVSTYTVPSGGLYQVNLVVHIEDALTAGATCFVGIDKLTVGIGSTWNGGMEKDIDMFSDSQDTQFSFTLQMVEGEQYVTYIQCAGGTKTVDVDGSGVASGTSLSIYKVP